MTTDISHTADLPAKFGFRHGDCGTMTSRTIMLAELITLFDSLPAAASKAQRWAAIIDDNILGKKTASTRRLTAQRLSELYALDPTVPLFRLLLVFWEADPAGCQLLALLCACARDPLLRMTAEPVLQTRPGERVSQQHLEEAVASHTGDRFNARTLNQIVRNTASSWTQSGHLNGRSIKRRTSPHLTVVSTAYALLLGFLCGARGLLLFQTFWTTLLDAPTHILQAFAREASSKGWLTYRGIDTIIEIDFACILTAQERARLDG